MSDQSPSSRSSGRSRRPFILSGVGLLLVGAGVWLRWQLDREAEIRPAEESQSRLLESEGLILDLTPKLKQMLNTSVMNLRLPDALGVELFADHVEWAGLTDSEPRMTKQLKRLGIRKYAWPVAKQLESTRAAECELWRPVFQSVDYFERAGFKFVRSHFDEDDPDTLVSDVAFEGLARDQDGGYVLVKAEQELRWQPVGHGGAESATTGPASDVSGPPTDDATDAGDPADARSDGSKSPADVPSFRPDAASSSADFTSSPADVPSSSTGDASPRAADNWRIVSWKQTSLKTLHAEQLLFEETLDQAVSDRQLRERLRNSRHEGYILDRYAALKKHAEWEGPHPYFSVVSQDRHPSVSVVDVDQDGLDDLYVMPRWGRNILLHNRGGDFDDVAADYGLDIDSHCASAIFADFDNDGDADLLLGRTLAPSQYLINEDGQFVDRTEELVDGGLPSLVTSASAADYNGDGRLDVYLCTYAANMQHDEMRGEGPVPDRNQNALLEDFLPEDVAEELHQRTNGSDYHRYLNYCGPPNLLLVNRGEGRLEPAPETEQAGIWRHTYQAAWSDFDHDGDPDLYLANDFAVNALMRNDGDGGFVDVAEETGTTDIGFGMGADWGDYDNDRRPDLYVSNMFSKAGRRITGSLRNIDERFGMMTRGNSLFRNQPDGFAKVSGLEAPDLQVEKAGWSWSGQFVDFDNDGWLDVHALSGYYTAPKEVAVKVDL